MTSNQIFGRVAFTGGSDFKCLTEERSFFRLVSIVDFREDVLL